MKSLDLLRDRARLMPPIPDASLYTNARVWHCKYRTLRPLAELANLQTLVVGTFPDSTFEPLSALRQLHTLQVLHLPRIRDLEALSTLTSLRRLSLRTLPSWDAPGRRTVVESLAPLTALPLEELELVGVLPAARTVDDILRIGTLAACSVSFFPETELARLARRFQDPVPRLSWVLLLTGTLQATLEELDLNHRRWY